MPTRGSYRIWAHGTNNVLDATQIENANVTAWRSNNRDWQQWAIRLQMWAFHTLAACDAYMPDSDASIPPPNRVAGYTLTPISQPGATLTMGSLSTRIPSRPAQIRPAPSAGSDVGNTQLWVLLFIGRNTSETAEEDQPRGSVDESEFESSYCEEVQALIGHTKEQFGWRAGEE